MSGTTSTRRRGRKNGYIPLSDRRAFGHLTAPKLRDGDQFAKLSAIDDMVEENVGVSPRKREIMEATRSGAKKRLEALLGATGEYSKVRFNRTYKGILDVLGTDFPLHPEYLFVVRIILDYYDVSFLSVIEFALAREAFLDKGGNSTAASATWLMRAPAADRVSSALVMVTYLLYVQYKCNPLVLADILGISTHHIKTNMDVFNRRHLTSAAFRADYVNIYSKLVQLEGE